MKKTWTKIEFDLLKKHYPTISDPRDILPMLCNKTYKAMKAKCKLLGLKREFVSNSPWTKEKVELFKKLYPTTKIADLIPVLGVTEGAMIGKAFKLKLLKDPAFKYECAKAGMFKKGTVPPNKGKKWEDFMSVEGMKNSRKTTFKKGNRPPNEQEDGDLGFRMDKSGNPYVYIRIKKAVWVLLQRYVWENTFGPIPAGHIVAFKDGNSMNCCPENLELINRKQNMLRNSASMNLSDGYIANCLAWRDKEAANEIRKQPLLIELKRESLKLNRTIYEQQKVS